MYHFIMDAFNGYRSRMDDIMLIYELLEEIPFKMEMKAVMPPFVLPYYNGIVPEDCGISGFVFLEGGHFTIHTFAYRETYFIDLLYPEPFNEEKLTTLIKQVFPAEKIKYYCVGRNGNRDFFEGYEIDRNLDFCPHLFLNIENHNSPSTMDQMFELLDKMPGKIGMTPIMRPYAIKNSHNGYKVVSVLTMIAESHISLHYFEDSKRAYMDLFSCKFFDREDTIHKIRKELECEKINEVLISRGSKYHQFKNNSDEQYNRSKSWLSNM